MSDRNWAVACAILAVALAYSLPTRTFAQARPAPERTPKMSCASVAGLALPNTQILSATEQSSPVAHCAIVGVINKRVSQQDPDHFVYGIGFALNLPDTWTGRFEMMGGGGSDGSLANPLGFIGTELAAGWAVA